MSPSLRLFKRQRRARHPEAAVHSFTHGGGFYRSFFATLKSGAGRTGGGLERLFITGVSPVTMDDVTSGFNIGTNISLEPDFNEMVGFTELEVRHLVETYLAAVGNRAALRVIEHGLADGADELGGVSAATPHRMVHAQRAAARRAAADQRAALQRRARSAPRHRGTRSVVAPRDSAL